jgi:hypothetical protein
MQWGKVVKCNKWSTIHMIEIQLQYQTGRRINEEDLQLCKEKEKQDTKANN